MYSMMKVQVHHIDLADSRTLANGGVIEFSGRCRVGIEPGMRVEHVGSTMKKLLII